MEKSSQSPATTQETQAPATPGRLDGVVIDSCVFTESVGKREPRPPLYCGKVFDGPDQGALTGSVFLQLQGFRVLLVAGDRVPNLVIGVEGAPQVIGMRYPGRCKGPRYTGPITPAMWAIIRKFWNP